MNHRCRGSCRCDVRAPLLIAAGLLAVAGAVLYRREQEGGTLLEAADSLGADIVTVASGYSSGKVPAQYRAWIAAAESSNGIPGGLLARLLWQESRYRPEIIDGRVKSPAGAMGIAQFMPATAAEWGVDPLDAESSIAGAGRYLAWLKARTGAWAMALAAYNWGIGNVMRKGMDRAPKETRDYFAQILSDVGLA